MITSENNQHNTIIYDRLLQDFFDSIINKTCSLENLSTKCKLYPELLAAINPQDSSTILHLIVCNTNLHNFIKYFHFHIKEEDLQIFQHRNLHGETPITIAVKNDNLEVLQALINSQIEAHKKYNNSKSAIQREIAETINIPNLKNKTPLHIAASHNNYSIVEYLLSLNANPLAVDQLDNTPAHLSALKYDDTETEKILSLFASYGVNPNTCNKANQTILQAAIETSTHYILTEGSKDIYTADTLWANKNTQKVQKNYDHYLNKNKGNESFLSRLLKERYIPTNKDTCSIM